MHTKRSIGHYLRSYAPALNSDTTRSLFNSLKSEAVSIGPPPRSLINAWSQTNRVHVPDHTDGPTMYALRNYRARVSAHTLTQRLAALHPAPTPGEVTGVPQRVWYATYGSNINRQRFLSYIQGDHSDGPYYGHVGATDPTVPTADIPLILPNTQTHFAYDSHTWGGGVAFLQPRRGHTTLSRAYNITLDQFADVVAQENGYDPGEPEPLNVHDAIANGHATIGWGLYNTITYLGTHQGIPVVTLTSDFVTAECLRTPQPSEDVYTRIRTTNTPSPAYLRTIAAGLVDTYGLNRRDTHTYLRDLPGANHWGHTPTTRTSKACI